MKAHRPSHVAAEGDWEQASFFSKWTFSIANKILDIGTTKVLEFDDLFVISEYNKTKHLIDDLKWQYKHSRAVWFVPRLLVAMIKARSNHCLLAFVYTILEGTVRVALPVILNKFLFSLQSSNAAEKWQWAVILTGLGVSQLVVHHVLFYFTWVLGWNWKSAAIGIIYDRLFVINSSKLATHNTGKLVNLISNDVGRFEEFAMWTFFFVVPVFEMIAILIILAIQLNVASGFAGVSVSILIIPLQLMAANRFASTRAKTSAAADVRVRYISEIINGIASVKAFGWTTPFYSLVGKLRNVETNSILESQIYRSANSALGYCMPIVAAFATFLVYWGTGGTLTVPVVFSTLSLIQTLKTSMTQFWTRSIERGSEAISSCERIEAFLNLADDGYDEDDGQEIGTIVERKQLRGQYKSVSASTSEAEIELGSLDKVHVKSGESQALVTLTPASYYYGSDSSVHVLKNINFSVARSELVIVCAPVGGGKSSLLSALLGELKHASNEPCRFLEKSDLRIAYCAQRAWILAATVKANVAMAGHYDGDFKTPTNLDMNLYSLALESCNIVDDLAQWANYDETEVGERGISISGGQKARVALARAVYSDADLFVLDDPLSACDAQVGKSLFFDCIVDVLKKRGKGIILATHQVQYLKYADKIIVLDSNGTQTFYGNYIELKERSSEFPYLDLSTYGSSVSEDLSSMEQLQTAATPEIESESSIASSSSRSLAKIKKSPSKYIQGYRVSGESLNAAVDGSRAPLAKASTLIIQAEDRQVGSISIDVVWKYLKSGGVFHGIYAFSLAIVGQVLLMIASYWPRWWSNQYFGSNILLYVLVYALLTLLSIVLGMHKASTWFSFTLKASSSLHERCLWAIIHSPLAFFVANPTGRILNRFAKDQNLVDELLPMMSFDCIQSLLFCGGGVVLICVSVPYMALMIPFLAAAFIMIKRRFSCSARELKRIDAIRRSPIYSDFSSTLEGLVTLRAYNLRKTFTQIFHEQVDNAGRTYFSTLMINRWFGFRMDMMSALMVAGVALLAVPLSSSVDTGLVGFALVYAFSLSGLLQIAVRQYADVETQLTAVERINTYAQLPPEPGYSSTLAHYLTSTSMNSKPQDDSIKPSKQINGQLELSHLKVTYRDDLEPVLEDITVTIKAGTKVGICGRTGSGKSSLIMALLRLNIIVDGDILVDGDSLLKMDLETSRSIMSLIPQDPTFFSGTVRFNLDPFGRYNDTEIWDALRDVQMFEHFTQASSRGLDDLVEEGGRNFSVGQRQLLSMARAILRKCKIVFMDEVTASIDFKTDQLLQAVIRTSPALKTTTIVTIAHRLRTIADSDAIIVINQGCIAEHGTPKELLQKEDGIFRSLALESSEEYHEIQQLADRI